MACSSKPVCISSLGLLCRPTLSIRTSLSSSPTPHRTPMHVYLRAFNHFVLLNSVHMSRSMRTPAPFQPRAGVPELGLCATVEEQAWMRPCRASVPHLHGGHALPPRSLWRAAAGALRLACGMSSTPAGPRALLLHSARQLQGRVTEPQSLLWERPLLPARPLGHKPHLPCRWDSRLVSEDGTRHPSGFLFLHLTAHSFI